jgi:hypothetical protein
MHGKRVLTWVLVVIGFLSGCSLSQLDQPGETNEADVSMEAIAGRVAYVSKTGSDTYPYNSWKKAARNIQSAVNAVVNNGQVIINDGTYLITQPIEVSNKIVVRSLNGRDKTFVDGNNSNRCFTLVSNAVIAGLTIQNGFIADVGGGVYGGIVSNCTISNNVSRREYHSTPYYGWYVGGKGGGVYGAKVYFTQIVGNSVGGDGGSEMNGGGASDSYLYQCVISNNTSISHNEAGAGVNNCICKSCIIANNSDGQLSARGAGALNSELYNCSVINNFSFMGGGICGGIVSNCKIYNNTAVYGAGAYNCTIYNSVLSNNSACYDWDTFNAGGGASQCSIYNSILVNNFSKLKAGGAFKSTLYNCLVLNNQTYGNSEGGGGGAQESALINCTVVSNSCRNPYTLMPGGGIYNCDLSNSIVYNNNGSGTNNNCYGGTLVSSWTSDPLFTNNFRLRSNSPCRNTGINQSWMTGAKDLAGKRRIMGGIVDIGCYEYVE